MATQNEILRQILGTFLNADGTPAQDMTSNEALRRILGELQGIAEGGGESAAVVYPAFMAATSGSPAFLSGGSVEDQLGTGLIIGSGFSDPTSTWTPAVEGLYVVLASIEVSGLAGDYFLNIYQNSDLKISANNSSSSGYSTLSTFSLLNLAVSDSVTIKAGSAEPSVPCIVKSFIGIGVRSLLI